MADGNQIVSKWDAGSAKATANAAAVRALVEEVRGQEAQIREGGGKKAVEAQHAKGRLTARERIDLLVDRVGGDAGATANTGVLRSAQDDEVFFGGAETPGSF